MSSIVALWKNLTFTKFSSASDSQFFLSISKSTDAAATKVFPFVYWVEVVGVVLLFCYYNAEMC